MLKKKTMIAALVGIPLAFGMGTIQADPSHAEGTKPAKEMSKEADDTKDVDKTEEVDKGKFPGKGNKKAEKANKNAHHARSGEKPVGKKKDKNHHRKEK